MMQLKNEGLVWGYDIPYLLTGKLNQHPSAAIAAMKEKRTDYARLYTELMDHE
jgi:4-hydroxy 2-oxovalerate aldolase